MDGFSLAAGEGEHPATAADAARAAPVSAQASLDLVQARCTPRC